MTTVNEMSRTIEAVQVASKELADFLESIDLNDWSRDSACPGWKVGDVAAHLTQGANGWIEFINRALQGDYGPPPGHQALQPGERGSEATASQAIGLRERQGDRELLTSFKDGYERFYQLLQTLQPEQWELPCFHRRGTSTIHEMTARRVQELVIHGWDIRSAFDPAHQLSDATVPVVAGMVHRWLNNTFCPGAHSDAPVSYRFDISGPAPVQEDVVVHHDRFEVLPTSSPTADVTFRGPATDYLLLIYGRLEVARLQPTRSLQIEGSVEQAARFNSWFKGI